MKKPAPFLFMAVAIFICSCSTSPFPTEEAIKKTIQQEVDNGRSPSIVVGILDHGSEFYFGYGKPFEGRDQNATENTIYEIASITKVFVSSIFADMVLEGILSLDDYAVDFFPDSLSYADPRVKQVKLRYLASHTAGLPRLIDDIDLRKQGQYYEDHSYTDLFAKLETAILLSDPGTKQEYSNINMSMLSYVLCTVSETDLDDLIRERICLPLGLENTALELNDEQKIHLATPYIRPGRPVKNWEWNAEAGAGGLRSSTKDLLTFMRKLFYDVSSLNAAAELATKAEFDSCQFPGSSMGLGWYITPYKNTLLYGHGGRHEGIRSLLMYDKSNERGIVILSNSGRDINDLGFYLLDKKSKVRNFQAVNPLPFEKGGFEKYAGRYSISAFGTNDTIDAYERDGLYFINSKAVGEFELIYRGKDRFLLEGENAEIEMKDFINGKSSRIEGSGISGQRI